MGYIVQWSLRPLFASTEGLPRLELSDEAPFLWNEGLQVMEQVSGCPSKKKQVAKTAVMDHN